jgi:hypothetical protein
MKTWRVQPCTFKTLAALYELTEKVLATHLKPFQHKIGKKIGHNFTVKQLLIIFEEYCTPPNIEVIYPEPLPVRIKQQPSPVIKS